MRARFILEIDPLASIEANMQFLRNCEKEIQAKKEKLKKLKSLKKIPENQIDLDDMIKNVENENNK